MIKLINSDCIKEIPKLKKESIDLIIADPPYNLKVDYGVCKDNLKKEDYLKWTKKWLKRCARVLKESGSIYIINYSEMNSYVLRFCIPKELMFQNWITWHYPTNIGHSKRNFTKILHLSKGNFFKFNNPDNLVIPDFLEINLVKNTSKEKVNGFPNQIPLKLMKILIKIGSNEGDTVLDPFVGCGTTASACQEMNRNCIGIELNADYVRMAKERLE